MDQQVFKTYKNLNTGIEMIEVIDGQIYRKLNNGGGMIKIEKDSVKIQMQTWKSKIYQAVPGCKTLHPVEGLQSIEVFKIYPYLKPDSSIMDSNVYTWIQTDFSCKKCNFSTSDKDGFRQPYKINPAEQFKNHVCRYFNLKRDPKKLNIYVHDGEKPIKCSIFSVKVHRRIPAGVTPNKREMYEFSSARKTIVYIHRLVRAGAKTATCHVCVHKAMQATCLKLHNALRSNDSYRMESSHSLFVNMLKRSGQIPTEYTGAKKSPL